MTNRTKTFTGCWTCRKRRIKCDLTRPKCNRCERSKIECAGYSVRLRWLRILNGSDSAAFDENEPKDSLRDTGNGTNQRRNLAFVKYPPNMTYVYQEDIDQDINSLNSPDLTQEDSAQVRGPFAVFRGIKGNKPNIQRRKSQRKARKYSPSISPPITAVDELNSKSEGSATGEANTDDNDSITAMHLRPSSYSQNFQGNQRLQTRTHFEIPNLPVYDEQLPQAPMSRQPSWNSSQPTMQTAQSQQHTISSSYISPLFQQQQQQQQPDIVVSIPTETAPRSLNPSAISMYDPSISDSVGTEQLMNSQKSSQTLSMISSQGEFSQQQPPQQQKQLRQRVPSVSSNTTQQASSLLFETRPTNLFYPPIGGNPVPEAVQFTDVARLLWYHYITQIPQIMTVVVTSSATSPWRSIHVPLAERAMGQISAASETSISGELLVHALMTVSSLHMMGKLPDGPLKDKFVNIGIQLRETSDILMNDLMIKVGSSAESSPFSSKQLSDLLIDNYEASLAATLTMVTVDVVYSRTGEVARHLEYSRTIIDVWRRQVQRIPTNAEKTLHRVAAFLTLIYKSTALNTNISKEVVDRNENTFAWLRDVLEVKYGDFSNELGMIPVAAAEAASAASGMQQDDLEYDWSLALNEFQQLSDDFYKKEFPSTQVLYGVSDTLIVIYIEVCRYVNRKMYQDTVEQSPHFAQNAQAENRLFIHRILAFANNENDRMPIPILESEKQREVYRLHSSAFLDALILYSLQVLLNDWKSNLFRKRVHDCLESLEALQRLDLPNEPASSPLVFSAFIGACGATDPGARERYLQWFANLASSGLSTCQEALIVIRESWARRDNNQPKFQWWYITEENDFELMLS